MTKSCIFLKDDSGPHKCKQNHIFLPFTVYQHGPPWHSGPTFHLLQCTFFWPNRPGIVQCEALRMTPHENLPADAKDKKLHLQQHQCCVSKVQFTETTIKHVNDTFDTYFDRI